MPPAGHRPTDRPLRHLRNGHVQWAYGGSDGGPARIPARRAKGPLKVARELLIVWAGRHRRRSWEELCSVYRRRIGRFVPVRDLPVRVRRAGEGAQRRRAEADALLAALPDPAWTVALDAGGDALTSEALAARLGRLRREWPHPVAFLLGSDLGLDPRVRNGAREVLSLGPMTLSHELARLVLYEQLYRSLAMDAGINYHRGSI